MKLTILSFIFPLVFTINAQSTYVPDDNFEQRLIELGLDDVLNDYVITANISGVTNLDIQSQSITDITGLEDFASLTSFNCDSNEILTLNFHPNVNLNFFICQNNPLFQLDLSQHTSLFEFSCTNTNITSLDLSPNTNLVYLYCRSTTLTYLDISNNPNLREIYAGNSDFEYVDVRNGNNELISSFNFPNNPNLPFIYVDDCNYSTANWTNIDTNSVFIEIEGQTVCEPLAVSEFLLASEIIAYPNPINDFLNLQFNKTMEIVEIDLLDVMGNKIKMFTTNFNKLDFRNLTSGLYFLYIKSKNGMFTKQIIKK